MTEPYGERFSGTWPRWALMWRGGVFELPTSEHLTAGIGSSPLLATPTAWLGRRPSQAEGDPERWHNPERSNELSDQIAAIALLPTPHGFAKEGQARRPGPTGNELGRALTLLPTPRERDWKGQGYEDQLPNVLKMLPTPNASLANYDEEPETWRGRREHYAKPRNPEGSSGLPLPIALKESSGATTNPPSNDGKPSTGLRLNPSFVEWMMGTPSCGECGREWTDSDCPHSATEFTSTSDGYSGTH
jgi:hypothetical protein